MDVGRKTVVLMAVEWMLTREADDLSYSFPPDDDKLADGAYLAGEASRLHDRITELVETHEMNEGELWKRSRLWMEGDES